VIANKKSILVLTPRFPYPVIGGDKLRIYHLCKVLSSQYQLTLLSLCESQDEMEFEIPDDGVFQKVVRIFLPKWKSYVHTVLALPSKTPLQVAYYQSRAFSSEISRLLPSHDAVLAHLIRTGDYVRNVNKPNILEMTDAISLNYGRMKQFNRVGSLKEIVYRIEAERLEKYERSIVNDFNLSVLVSSTDRDYLFGNHGREDVLVCSNGVDLSGLPFSTPSMSNKVVAFVGNMRTVQNLDACNYFINDILPLLRERGDYKFRIVGAISDELANHFRKYANVEVTGRIDSITSAVADVSIGVCPMRVGAGVQNKVLEYMALGLPTVTTTIGYEGIDATPGLDLLIADTPEAFVEQITWLSEQHDDAIAMAHNARKFVEATHNWSSILQPFTKRLNSLI
jgi:glycosyltransferase involved in cell wall biosynthesis